MSIMPVPLFRRAYSKSALRPSRTDSAICLSFVFIETRSTADNFLDNGMVVPSCTLICAILLTGGRGIYEIGSKLQSRLHLFVIVPILPSSKRDLSGQLLLLTSPSKSDARDRNFNRHDISQA